MNETERILDLEYQRLLTSFHPSTQKEDAKTLSRFNQLLNSKLKDNDNLYSYSTQAGKYLEVHIIYKTHKNTPNLIDETTSSLEDIAQESGFKGNDNFLLNSSRVLPFDVYKAEVHKQILSSLFKQIAPRQ